MSLEQIAKDLYKERYLKDTPALTDNELEEVLAIIFKLSGNYWRLVQHKNIEPTHTYYELDLQPWSENIYTTSVWE